MIFTETALPGAYIIDLELKTDARGFFARVFSADEFAEHGLSTALAQMNLSYNHLAGTWRGLHFQTGDAAETKLVRCLRGTILDVIVDLRPDSPTYLQHLGVELTDDNRRALYVPKHFAHGYQALTDDAEVLYQVDEFYTPAAEGGLRWDDPHLGISLPRPVTAISDKDRSWPLLDSTAGA